MGIFEEVIFEEKRWRLLRRHKGKLIKDIVWDERYYIDAYARDMEVARCDDIKIRSNY